MKSYAKFHSRMNSIISLRIHLFKNAVWQIIFIILSFSSLFSCADDDNDFQTFLEKNDGTEWVLQNENLKVYIRLNNNKDHLIEQWSYNEKIDCYDYNPNIFSPGDFEIKENSSDQLIILGDVILSDFECLTLSRQDNILTAHFILCEWQEESTYFMISSIGVETLISCN